MWVGSTRGKAGAEREGAGRHREAEAGGWEQPRSNCSAAPTPDPAPLTEASPGGRCLHARRRLRAGRSLRGGSLGTGGAAVARAAETGAARLPLPGVRPPASWAGVAAEGGRKEAGRGGALLLGEPA